jgi:hypothetical protein
MALRVDYGGDYRGYKDFFESIHFSGINEESSSEFGYQLLNLILPSFRWVIIASSLLFCSSIYFLFHRYIPSRHWIIAFIIVFVSKSMLLGNMSGIRNGIAVSFFIFGFYFLEKNKKVLYILLLLFASLFHTSSLLFLPLVFINIKRLTTKKIRLLWIIVILFTLVTTLIPNVITTFSLWLISNVNILSKYNLYLEGEITYGFRGLSFVLIFFMLFMNIGTLKAQKIISKEVLLIKLSVIFYLFMLLPGIGLLSRLYFYLSFPQLAGNIYVMRRINNKYLRWVYILGMLLFPIIEFYYYSLTPTFKENILSYHSILGN